MPLHTLEAAEKPLLDIFCDKYLFRIPGYQRPYAWTTEQASDQPVLLRLDEAIGAGGATYEYSIITVEHVLPQNPSAGSRWLVNFPDEQARIAWVHRLANLVLLTRRKNTQASNLDFEDKKIRYFSPAGGVSNFALTNTVIHEPRWDVATPERRCRTAHRSLASGLATPGTEGRLGSMESRNARGIMPIMFSVRYI
jgi:hypothetical protein